jgi:hypothetical protein
MMYTIFLGYMSLINSHHYSLESTRLLLMKGTGNDVFESSTKNKAYFGTLEEIFQQAIDARKPRYDVVCQDLIVIEVCETT